MYYKLTDQNQEAYNIKWTLYEWRYAYNWDPNQIICTNAWLYGYLTPELAVLFNPLHANFEAPRLFKAEVEGNIKFDGQIRFGAKQMRIVEEMALPVITKEQRIRFGILCALKVNQTPEFVQWANNWLNNVDRTAASAIDISNTIYWIAYTNKQVNPKISNPAFSANYAAEAAASLYSDIPAASFYATYDDFVFNKVAYAAYCATRYNPNIDLISIIERL